MRRFIKRYLLWSFYILFFIAALAFGGREGLLATQSGLTGTKYAVFVVFVLFLGFSIYATRNENFFRSIRAMNQMLWGRQVGFDLYISVCLSLALIYLVEGSVWILLLWLVPILVFANLAILPYILLNFAEIIGHFQL